MTVTLEQAQRLVKVATGDEWGDGMIVTDMGVGIAEPGYGYDETPWVAGDWNEKTKYVDGERIVTDNTPKRLGDALERLGIETLWLDEWTTCGNCGKAIRTQPDSYSWQPYYMVVNECEISCRDCIESSWDADFLEEHNMLNNPRMAVHQWVSDTQLTEWGFSRHNGIFENGWHPGQTDDPVKIFDAIRDENPSADVVFRIDENSQFYMRFTAWVK